MTSVTTDMLVSVQTVSNSSATESKSNTKTDGASFEEVLTKAMPTCDEMVTNTDCETQADVKELITKLLQTISNGCSEQDIKQLTDGLSDEQLNMLTEIIGEITQIISEGINTSDYATENPLADAIISVIGNQSETTQTQKASETIQLQNNSKETQSHYENEINSVLYKNETDKNDVHISDEVLSNAFAAIAEILYSRVEDGTDTVYKTAENITPQIIESLSENTKDKLINIENVLNNLSNKVSQSNPQMSEFATKLQSISQEISKTINTSGEQMSQIKFTDIKVSTTPVTQEITKEKPVISNESFDKTLIKVNKNQSELSELTALTGNVKTEIIGAQGEQIKSVEAPVENQVLNFIKTEVLPSVKTSGTTEMAMTLNPEQLGEISVKLAKTGTELTVAITCSNSVTQEMIENRLPQLISSLSTGENKTVDVTVVTPNQNASEFMNNFNMSQQNGHQQFESQHSQTHYFENNEVIDSKVEVEEIYKEGRLWQTV